MLNFSEYAGAFRAGTLALTNRAWLLWNAYPSFMLGVPWCMSRQSFSGLRASPDALPQRARASMMALATAGAEPMVPASPMPLPLRVKQWV